MAVIREKGGQNKQDKINSPIVAARPSKKRRESFLPQPASRRQSVSAGENASDVSEPKKHKFLTRRLSMGPASFGGKNAKISAGPPKRRSSRLSIAPSSNDSANKDQENVEIPQNQPSILSKGIKMISDAMKGDNKKAICPESDVMNEKLTSKVKSNQETKALALRASNRRKSLAMVSKTLQGMSEFDL